MELVSIADWSKKGILFLITGYHRYLSPILPPSCRFFPSCSAYTHEAVMRHGCLKGLWLGLTRLLRCHPFDRGGVDQVP